MIPPTGPLTLEQLVAQRDWVRRVARTMTADDATAEDLVQDAYLAALRSPPRRDGWRGWMRRVLTNRSRNLHREGVRRATRETAHAPARAERPAADVVAEADAHRHVVDAVLDLEEPLRTTVLLRYFEDLGIEDVARRMDAPIETTRSRLRRAREILCERLDAEHGTRGAWCAPLLGNVAGPGPGLDDASRGEGASGPTPARAGTATHATAALALVGGLLMKKSIAAVVVFLLAGGALWLARSDGDGPPSSTASGGAAPAPQQGSTAHAATIPRTRARADGPETPPAGDVGGTQGAPDNDAAAANAIRGATATRRIAGTVTASDGSAVANAHVAVVASSPAARPVEAAPSGGTRVAPSAPEPSPATPLASATTKPDGSYSVEFVSGAESIAIVASAEGFAPSWVVVAAADERADVCLRRAVTLRVRVLGPGGRREAGRRITVDDETGSGRGLAWGTTGADGEFVAPGLPGGLLVSVRTDAASRIGGLRNRLRLADAGESVTELRDDGVRRILVHAEIDGADVPVGGVLVELPNGPGEIRAWPGGTAATVEIPAGDVELNLVTAAGRGTPVRPAADADEVTVRVKLPTVRWVEVEIGDLDPRLLQIVGGRDAAEAFFAGDLSPFARSGRLRLPFVEGAEYSLRRPDGSERLLGSHTEGRVSLAEPPARVAVRILAASGPLPSGAKAVAEPILRATRMAREKAEATVSADGSLTLSLLPGITYGVVVSAPGSAPTRIEHRPGMTGGDVRVELRAGTPLRFRIAGLAADARCAVATFPGYAKLEARVAAGSCEIDGAGDGWVLVMAGGAVHLVRGGEGSDARSAPASSGLVPDVSGRPAGRMFLLGLDPVADGVRAVGLAGVPMTIPAGRYLPVEWRDGEIAVYAAVSFDASTRTWMRPDDADVTWTQGTLDGNAPADLVLDLPAGVLPLGRLVPDRVTRWRSATQGVRTELVR